MIILLYVVSCGVVVKDVKQFSGTDSIVGVKSFFTFFVYHQFTHMLTDTSSSEDLINLLKNESLPFLRVGVQKENMEYFTKTLSFFSISSQRMSIHVVLPSFQSCRKENIFESYDALFMDTYNFTYYVRAYRDTNTRKSTLNGMINSFDFLPFPLLPSVVFVDVNGTKANSSLLFEFSDMTCQNSYVSDAEVIRSITGYSGFSQTNMNLLRYVLNKTVDYNSTLYNAASEQFFNLHPQLKTSNWSSLLLPSSCHYCSTTLCEVESFSKGDIVLLSFFVPTIVYFLCLFVSGSYKMPALQRRVLVPYIPIVAMIMWIFSLRVLTERCVSAVHYTYIVITIWWIMIYSFTVIRFVYLRNLYQIVSNSKHKKVHKYLSSFGFGVLFTGVLSLVASLVLTAEAGYLFTLQTHDESLYVRTIITAVFFISGCLIALLVVAWDMFLNRKNIQSKGMIKFLVFDDPFYIR